ncbi:preprotein translocase subunit SecG [Brevundimonas sp. Leaf363]|uniref:preprotein translocase subunit SecG n=1 Tax=Brevundimonas sp. Leaf363 TaxID=1736353 RepID=UPI0006F884F2|nr:preprotein translocase subunit SecG [Brevundimonas sp. Leaf363]KQS56432.1 preprotein translocase subunit SecG [Brevundimonas sp. Leaf363]
MLQTILLVAQILISIALAGVILLQRSEGGALGMGGGPSGFMTARGAGNLLTVTTWWLAAAFFICAIALTVVGNMDRASQSVIDADAVGALAAPSAGQQQAPAETAPAPATPSGPSLDDLEASLPAASTQAPAPAPAPAQ